MAGKYEIYYIGISDLEDTYKTSTIISINVKNTLIDAMKNGI
jgi:hypothetical protein